MAESEHSAESAVLPSEGDIALVTQRDGTQYVGVYTLAPGIDYFWRPVIRGTGGHQLVNPDVAHEVIGRVTPAGEGS